MSRNVNMDEGEESSGGVWLDKGPSEEEQASWEQQRQRREKLSSLMGQYLLKGYRMLGSNCSDCGASMIGFRLAPLGDKASTQNILLQTRDGVNYCVQCSELFQEGRSPPGQPPSQLPTAPNKADADSGKTCTVQNICTSGPNLAPTGDDRAPISHAKDLGDDNESQPKLANVDLCVSSLEEVLVGKLQWASRELANASSVEDSTQLCVLIKACAEALKSVRELDSKPHSGILKTHCNTNCCH